MKKVRSHWRARYIVDRSMEALYRITHPLAPWLTPESIRLLDRYVDCRTTVFEFGSGRSTLWFARRVRRVVTVEHNADWFQSTEKACKTAGITNVKLLHNPILTKGDREKYAQRISTIEGRGFDVVLIDGAARELCTKAALSRVVPGGLLVIDNVNRYLPSKSRAPDSRSQSAGPLSSEWAELSKSLSKWSVVWTSSGVTDTAVFTKPRE
jgi:predicted O-methyltransferase YrrM